MPSEAGPSRAPQGSGPTSKATGPSTEATTNRLYIGNLASSVDEYALIQLFQRFGKVTKLDFMYHKTGALKGKPRGYAFIELGTKEDAQKAMIKLHDRLLRGRKLVVTPASSAPLSSDSAPLSLTHKGRRSEPAKTTTLSLLKSKGKQKSKTSAAAQIAAMEAKLAMMQRKKPADEDWIPGQKFGASGRSTREGTYSPGAGQGASTAGENEMDIEEELGIVEGAKAADELEREMAEILGGRAPPPESSTEPEPGRSDDANTSPIPLAVDLAISLPSRPDPLSSERSPKTTSLDKSKSRDKAEKVAEANAEKIQRGFATLPRKPAFL